MSMISPVLVADGDPAFCRFVEETGRRVDVPVVAVSDARAVSAAMAEHRPKLVLLDLAMATAGGFDLLTLFREHRSVKQLAVVSGSDPRLVAAIDHMAEACRLWSVEYWDKPIASDFLAGKLELHRLNAPAEMARDLDFALREKRLSVVFQPQLHLARKKIVRFEALARWRDARRGNVLPERFIPVADEMGLIGALTEHVLDLALSGAAALRRIDPDVGVSVNIAASSFEDEGLPGSIKSRLRRTSVPASALTLEVTESLQLRNFFRTLGTANELKAMGCRLSIDDFGIGFSSLGRLRSYDLDEVKIDRSFVSRILSNGEDARMVSNLVDLGRNLGLDVVGEGVEDIATLEWLQEHGCDIAQGFFVGSPLPLEATLSFFEVAAKEPFVLDVGAPALETRRSR